MGFGIILRPNMEQTKDLLFKPDIFRILLV